MGADPEQLRTHNMPGQMILYFLNLNVSGIWREIPLLFTTIWGNDYSAGTGRELICPEIICSMGLEYLYTY